MNFLISESATGVCRVCSKMSAENEYLSSTRICPVSGRNGESYWRLNHLKHQPRPAQALVPIKQRYSNLPRVVAWSGAYHPAPLHTRIHQVLPDITSQSRLLFQSADSHSQARTPYSRTLSWKERDYSPAALKRVL